VPLTYRNPAAFADSGAGRGVVERYAEVRFAIGRSLSKNDAVRIPVLLVLSLLALGTPTSTQAPSRYDVLIRNGRVLDGSGNPWLGADIGIRGGRIVDMGRLGNATAARVIDAAGLTVSPGFIDVHSHASEGLAGGLKEGRQLIAQGITTVGLNPDGGGTVDLRTQRAGFEQRGIGVNVALYVPHGSIRREVLGMADRAPTAAEIDRMVAMARSGMEAGGIGLSSGLYYAPGSYAKTEEVIALAKVVGEMGGVYESHIRDEADYNVGVVAAVQEVIRISEEGHLPGIVAHMKALGPASWGLSMALVERIQQARDRGVEVYADQYPYDASGTGIVGALIPRWAEVGGRAEMVKRIQGADHDRLAADIRRNLERRGGPATLVVSRYLPNPAIEGQSLADIAKGMNKPADEAAMDMLLKGDASLVSFNMTDRDIDLIMRQPFTMTCTDGDLVPFGVGKPHPRGNGAFARKIRVYVNERHTIDLPFAVRSMTSLPASVFGLKDRGVLRPGAWADILIFDPARVRDTATYLEPHQMAEGMEYVLVNGAIEKDANAFTGKLGGRVVTPDRR
jgi:N-acyl-D-aspartate/D-glutamate deacylase